MTTRITVLAAAALLGAALPSHAVVDEAHSLIMEAAVGAVENGYLIRADYWSGELESGKQKLVRHQLFRGNDYRFWVATSLTGCEIQIEVYDAMGTKVTMEPEKTAQCHSVRVQPAATGSYYILVKIVSKEHPKVDWALVYGYR